MTTKFVPWVYRVTITRTDENATYYKPKVETRIVTQQGARAIKKNNDSQRRYALSDGRGVRYINELKFERAPVGEFEPITDP